MSRSKVQSACHVGRLCVSESRAGDSRVAKREIVSVSLCTASDLHLCIYHPHSPSDNSKQSRTMLIKVKVGTPLSRALGQLPIKRCWCLTKDP